MKSQKLEKRIRRHKKIRAKIKGSASTPRISVFRSNRHLFVQLIDDSNGKTLASVNDISNRKNSVKVDGDKKNRAEKIGEFLAAKARELGVDKIVFDRGGYKYHGRVKALAEGLRKGGIKF